MKNRDQTRGWIVAGIIGLGLVACCNRTQAAEWGSIRANNREHGDQGARRGEVVTANRPRETHVDAREVNRNREARVDAGRAGEFHYEHAPEPVRGHPVFDGRHYDVDVDRHHGYYWSDYHPGMFLNTLPPGYLTFSVGGVPYYYYEGVYYEPSTSGYAVVAPPAGVTVSELPPGAEAVSVGGTIYYYAGGVFYAPAPNGFSVVPAPLGVTVTTLPPGAAPVTVNGVLYYMANNNYFQPLMQNGLTVYMTVRP